jgi:threonine/homoserine/homoserine lactone efflux protein
MKRHLYQVNPSRVMQMNVFKNGLLTGLFLQLAIGPIFFFIINLALQRTIFDGLIAAVAVTVVDYLYITLSIFGLGKILEKKKFEKIFGIISSIVLIIVGVVIIRAIISSGLTTNVSINSTNLLSSFLSVFFLTLSNPMTIVFFTSVFTAKAIELNYSRRELYVFGIAVGLATYIFMSISVLVFSLLKGTMPIILIQVLNLIVGFVLIGYGGIRLLKCISKSY